MCSRVLSGLMQSVCGVTAAAVPRVAIVAAPAARTLAVSAVPRAQALKATTSSPLAGVNKQIVEQAQRLPLFAVVHIGGKQYKITDNDIIVVNKIGAEVGSKIKLEKVLMVGSPQFTVVGTPLLDKDAAVVSATVIEQMKSKRVIVFKMKRRKGYKLRRGHRQDLTLIRINSVAITKEVV